MAGDGWEEPVSRRWGIVALAAVGCLWVPGCAGESAPPAPASSSTASPTGTQSTIPVPTVDPPTPEPTPEPTGCSIPGSDCTPSSPPTGCPIPGSDCTPTTVPGPSATDPGDGDSDDG
jgi:hypothetical protein